MDQALKDKIENAIKSKKVFLFMKGTPAQPMCGFSAGVVSVLNQLDIDYGSFNIFDDENVRQGIKEYSNWPTLPQLYIDGEFVGGHDIIVQMARSGDLQKQVSG